MRWDDRLLRDVDRVTPVRVYVGLLCFVVAFAILTVGILRGWCL